MKTCVNRIPAATERLPRIPLGLLLACLHLSALPAPAQAIITTYAGGATPVHGSAVSQGIDSPNSVVSDGAGGFYFSGGAQNRVYRVFADGYITAIAGDGFPGFGGDGQPAIRAQLRNPGGLALDRQGNLFIADSGNRRVRKVTPDGVIRTVAGGGTTGNCCSSGDGGPATSAQLHYPIDVAIVASGNLLIADADGNRIRRVSADGTIRTIAGTGTAVYGGDGGPATSAQLVRPSGVAADVTGNVFIADGSHRIRKITADGTIRTIAGNGTPGYGGDEGPATFARLQSPRGVAVDVAGNVFIADGSHRIRKVTADGTIHTIAGNGTSGNGGDEGPAILARLSGPMDMTVDAEGSLFIADSGNLRVRKVTPDDVIHTVAGNGSLMSGEGGLATSAALAAPTGVAFDGGGNLYVADFNNHRVHKVSPDGTIRTFAGNGSEGYSGDGGPAVSASLAKPFAVAVDVAGNVFVADCSRRIRKIDSGGVISTLGDISTWGFCSVQYTDDLLALGGLATDPLGNLFIADAANQRVYKATPNGLISIAAGTGTSGFSGDGGPATSAQLSYPGGVALDKTNGLIIADSDNHRIRRVTPSGIISTIAGTGACCFNSEEGSATTVTLGYPVGVAVDPAGNVLIADLFNNRIRKVSPSGYLTRAAGNGDYGFFGEGTPAVSASLAYPSGIAVNESGNLFIADTGNQRVRRVLLNPAAISVSGISPSFGAQGSTVNLTLSGTGLLFINEGGFLGAGSGVTITRFEAETDLRATFTIAIGPNAPLGPSHISFSNVYGSLSFPFTVVPPFPDLSIRSSHSGNLVIGFEATYSMQIINSGSAATIGPITVTDILPLGLTFVSAMESGWSCSSLGQMVTCTNPGPMAPGTSTLLTLMVKVGSHAPPRLIHSPKVAVAGDRNLTNDAASDTTDISPILFQLDPPSGADGALPAGRQVALGLTLPVPAPQDVTGTLKLEFSPNAANPADDPAIQFETGGREIAFTIPANTQQARFGAGVGNPSLLFQTGTIAGALTFNGTLQTDSGPTGFSTTQHIPKQAPSINAVRLDTLQGMAAVVGLSSTFREVTQLMLRFDTTPVVRLSCNAGCSVSGNTVTLDVKPLFDAWFIADKTFGGLSSIRLPLSIPGGVRGTVWVTLRNSLGLSNSVSLELK